MTRNHKNKQSNEFYNRREKYKAALARLREMQAEAERDENRYYCRCESVAETAPGDIDPEFADMFKQIDKKVFGDGFGMPKPIDPDSVTGMEIIYRTLMNAGEAQAKYAIGDAKADIPTAPTDGYHRWEPDREPRNAEECKRLQELVSREIRALQSRKDRGYNMSAQVCAGCPESDMEDPLAPWLAYAEQVMDGIEAHSNGELDWPHNVPPLFRIQPKT